MWKIGYRTATLLCLLIIRSACFSQIQEIDALKVLPEHPRILFLKNEEKGIEERINSSDMIWKNLHNSVLNFCDSLLNMEPADRILTGKRLLGVSREYLRRILYFSYSWRMTHNDKYSQKAEAEMLSAANFSDWNPSHFLDVAEMTMALAIGYDWLYEALPESSREKIKEAIIEKGLKISLNEDYNKWLKSIHNWNQVCNGGLLIGALAVFEDQPGLSATIINRAMETISLPMKNYNPDGNYPEGFGYWNYGTTYNVILISAFEKAVGMPFSFDDYGGFTKTASYMLHMKGPSGLCFNYSDNKASAELNPVLFWFADRFNDPSVLWNIREPIEDFVTRNNQLTPLLIIWGKNSELKSVRKPRSVTWFGHGETPVALMRTSWNNSDAIFVGAKGGTCQASHSHMDAGSFVMESEGVRWAMDFGSQSYYSLESKGVDLWNRKQDSQRWQVFRYNNLVHNTITVNNEFQCVDGYAPLIGFSDKRDFMHAIFDLTDTYKGQLLYLRRGVAIVDQKFVMIRDEFRATGKETTIRWTMLTPADIHIKGNNLAELTCDGRKLFLKIQQPGQVKLKTWSTNPSNEFDAPNTGTSLVGFEITVPEGFEGDISVLLIPDKAYNHAKYNNKPMADWH